MTDEETYALDDDLPPWADEVHDIPPDEPEDGETVDENRFGNPLEVPTDESPEPPE